MCVKAFKNCLVFSVITLCLIYAPQSKADHKEKNAISIMQDELNKLNQTQHHIRHSRHKSLEIEIVPDYVTPLVDISCISHGMVKAPTIKNGKVVRYIHKKLPLSLTAKENEHKGFLVAMYTCLDGYEFEINGTFKMYCSKRTWIGKKPKCLKIIAESYELNDDAVIINAGILSNSINCSHEFRKNCEQGCIIENGQPICICYSGFILLENKCIDINECDNENVRKICQGGCINTQGSYRCISSDVNFEKRKEYIDNSSGIHYVPDKIYEESVEDEEGSGSGDYTNEEYSEENNENEDDEDYVGKFVYKNISYHENKKESDDVRPILEEESTTRHEFVNNSDSEEHIQENDILTTNFVTTTESYIQETTYSDEIQIGIKENDILIDTHTFEYEKETSGKESTEGIKINEIENTTEYFAVTEVGKIDNHNNKEEDRVNTDTNFDVNDSSTNEPSNFNVTNNVVEDSNDFKFQIKAITPSSVVHIDSEDNNSKIEKEYDEDSDKENYEENYDDENDNYNEVDYKEEEEEENVIILTTTPLIDTSKTLLTTETHPEATTTEVQTDLKKINTNLIENIYDRGDDDYYNEINYDETNNYNLENDQDKVINVLESTSFKTPIESATEVSKNSDDHHNAVTILQNINTGLKEADEEFTTSTVFDKNHDIADDDTEFTTTTMPYIIIPTEIAVSVVSDTPHDLTTGSFNIQTQFEVDNHIDSDEVTTLASTVSIEINKSEEYDDNYISTTRAPNIVHETHSYRENKSVLVRYDKNEDYEEENYKNDYGEENYSDNDVDTSTPNKNDTSYSTEDYQDGNNNKEDDKNYYYGHQNETTTIPNDFLDINQINKNISNSGNSNEKNEEKNYDTSTSTPGTSYINVIGTTNSYDANELEEEEDETKGSHKNVEIYDTTTLTPTYTHDINLKTTEKNINKESGYKEEYDEEGTNDNKFNTKHNNNSAENIDYKENEDYEENYENHNYDDENYPESEYDDKEVKHTISSSGESDITNNTLSCPQGFLVTETNCEDINECQETNGNCSHECENTLGSYRCLCPLGYTLSFENHHLCVDIDECIEQPCSHECINEIGSFRCDCPENYYLFNQTTCLEVICSYDFIKLDNTIECICPTGFILGKDNYTCEDVDECISSDTHNCSQICENVEGSFTCSCEEGYLLISDTSTCEDINECEDVNLNDCFQICDNVNGSFNCACFDGYELTNGTRCHDVNECSYNNGNCSHICVNGEGFHECTCPDKYYLMDDNMNCKLLNPCELHNGGCPNICVNENGSAICTCPDGYEIVNDNCILIDNCDINNGGCSHFCKNDKEGISCSCLDTHDLINETHCEEIDQCTFENGGCSHICKTINSNIICYCPETHMLSNETHCIHRNYCMENNGNCSHICTWSENEVICSCPDGYELTDDKFCFKLDPCKINNGYCSHICIETNDQIECQCPINYKLINKTTCVETDTCDIDNGGCSHDCFYDDKDELKCGCPQNYELKDNKICVEINPCLIDNGGCSHDCLYENASIKCLCPENHFLEGKTCRLADPCKIDNGGCSHICENVLGEAFCKCPPGLKLINRFCLEVNPCAMKNGGCSHFCTNVNGTAQCSCPVGYKIRPNKRNCKEINYCRPNNGGCSHGCRNLHGSHECTCPNGYAIDSNNKTSCLDINECLSRNGGCQQLCINFDGGYKCACREEYHLETNRRSCKPVYSSMCPALVPPQNGNTRCMQMHPNQRNAVPVGTQCLIWCEIGYKLRGESIKSCNSQGNWGNKPSYCIAVSCPKLGNVARGYFTPESCTKTRLFPGEMCSLKCNQGYKPSREFETITCLSSLQWSSIVSESRLENACTQDTFEPFIRCPKGGSLTYTLPLGKNQMLITIPKPDSNVDWWRYVSSKPNWGMELSRNLPPGRTDVIYTARSPVTNNTVSCRLIITIVDKEVPQIVNCPSNIEYRLLKNEYNKVIYWSEPEFTDNVEVVGIYKSREPGTKFGMGIHYVYYIARDESGNQAKCYFTINIKASIGAQSRRSNDKAVLICPHGIRYISKSSESYNNEALKQEGCYWGDARARKPIKEHSAKIRSENILPESRSKRYHPFYWYNRCC